MFSFGTKPVAPTTTPSAGLFGGASTNMPATSLGFGYTQQQQPAAQTTPTVSSFSAHPFQYIQQCYDQNSLNYRFRNYFYNLVEGGVVKYPTSKPANISDRLWTQIMNDNPDPNKMIPIIANGFEDLKARASWQDEQMTAQSNKIKELENRLGTLLKKSDLETTSQLQQIQRQQLTLIKKIIGIMKIFEVKRRSGHHLQPAEETLKSQIQVLLNKLSSQPPLDSKSLRAIQFQVQNLQDMDRLDPLFPIRHLAFEEPNSIESIKSILLEQQKGIRALTEVLIKDAKDLEIMRYGFQL